MLVDPKGLRDRFGRAIPRAWFAQAEPFEARDVVTPFGKVSVRYESSGGGKLIRAGAQLDFERAPGSVQLRIRHPERLLPRVVRVNGTAWSKMDPERGDIDLTGLSGKIEVIAEY